MTYTQESIRAIIAKRDRCLKAVSDEPELPDSMPDEMWEAIRNDRDAVEYAMRTIVRQTKQGIRDRIIQ